jgi:hypothetical protein
MQAGKEVMMKLYAKLAMLVQARLNCIDGFNSEWKLKLEEKIEELVRNHLPSGSGFDSGTKIDLEVSNNRLVFCTAYHHMDENGSYDGWTEHVVRVSPSFHGVHMTVSGRNRNGIKDYIYESFDIALNTEV